MKIRVYYEDTDLGGIVYHSNYLNFCERARSELFFEKGLLPIGEASIGFVVRHIDAHFLSTASLGDLLDVTTKVIEKKRASITLYQQVTKEEKKLFTMEILLVYIDHGKIRSIPSEFDTIFSQSQKK
jgi:acyl-CoA thioester hydrolase